MRTIAMHTSRRTRAGSTASPLAEAAFRLRTSTVVQGGNQYISGSIPIPAGISAAEKEREREREEEERIFDQLTIPRIPGPVVSQ